VQLLPASVKSWLADLDAPPHPDAGALPLSCAQPSESDIRGSVIALESQLRSAPYDHVVFCVAKLITGFNERLTKDEGKARARLWYEVIGDVPTDLWSAATIELLQTWKRDEHYGRVPEASDLRAVIEARLAKRQNDLRRCRHALAKQGKTDTPAEQPIATRLGRLEHTRAIYVRMKRVADVERIDREIAKERGEAAPVAPDMGIPITDERPPFKPSGSPSARRCAELAAARHQKRAPNPTPEWDAVPEAAA